MPRGFLVKRSKRGSPASYRAREEDRETPKADLPTQTHTAGVPTSCTGAPQSQDPRDHREVPTEIQRSEDRAPHFNSCREPSASPGHADAAYSPLKPVGAEQTAFFDRCLSSPATAESFPLSPPVSSIERLLMNRDSPVHLYPFHPAVRRAGADVERKTKPAAKKPKVLRKLNFEDEVTTSPVLGLKIKKEAPESRAGVSSAAGNRPLGEFICQLCKEEYPDPFSLAQHKCSRIVRVDYRCPECDKVFSCPANLASHRRWHKPRAPSSGEMPGGKKSLAEGGAEQKPPGEGKENASKLRVNGQHHAALDSSGCQRLPDGARAQDWHRTSPDVPPPGHQRYVSPERRFELHVRSSDGDPASSAAGLAGGISFPCPLCGAHFPSPESRDKHRSTGLTRHINKSHPTESRQVMLLQMALRPGC
uniref:C2H2-type domain-containing protein n=1 Tax=Denticeps clupeoides TaxID=299321 RepID=A0AAY4BCH5_9TELE